MKIIITENKLFNSITKYLEDTFIEEDELNLTYAEDLNGNHDENLLIIYRGDWEGEDYSDIVFAYYTKDYFDDIPSNSHNRATSPVLMVQKYHELNEMFGQYWKEPMKKWFEGQFNLPVRSITSY
jgi:hypothetical protein